MVADYRVRERAGVMASVGHSKVFILDKYFTELQKFWETEIKLQGIYVVQIYVYGSIINA